MRTEQYRYSERRRFQNIVTTHRDQAATDENHVSWAHMYRMMFALQIGLALAYVL